MKEYLNTNFDQVKVISAFDELPLWSAPFGLKLLDAIDYKTDMTVLDVGFGSGFPLTELAMRLGNSSVVYGIDSWKAILPEDKVDEVFDRIETRLNEFAQKHCGVKLSIPFALINVTK